MEIFWSLRCVSLGRKVVLRRLAFDAIAFLLLIYFRLTGACGTRILLGRVAVMAEKSTGK